MRIGRKKRLPDHVVGALRALDEAGYVFVKDSIPAGQPSLRVYFGAAPAARWWLCCWEGGMHCFSRKADATLQRNENRRGGW